MKASTLIKLKEVGSTNDHLKMLMVQEELPEGFVVLADYQNKGRGMNENNWESERGKNLTFSLLLQPSFLPATDMFLISKIISLGIIDYLNSLGKSFSIKWPNDIYFNNKKLSGILIENQLLGNTVKYSLIGVGLNVNQEIFNSNAPNPISLINILEKKINKDACLKGILKHISFWYEKLADGLFDEINDAYFHQLFRNLGYHWFSSKGQKFQAKILSVENDGQLFLKTEQHEIRSFYFKEVEFIL